MYLKKNNKFIHLDKNLTNFFVKVVEGKLRDTVDYKISNNFFLISCSHFSSQVGLSLHFMLFMVLVSTDVDDLFANILLILQ